jgi:hexosaminidase
MISISRKCLHILMLPALVLLFSLQQATGQVAQNDFTVKGFHLDLRIQVMKMPALKTLALRLKKDGYNTLIMEYEGTYPYRKHPLISNRYAYSEAEITDFVRYCGGLGIDVIPLQQSFGHVEYILRNSRYALQREDQKDLSQVCPSREDLNRALFTDLFTELVKTHSSKYIHIGGDETHLLGHCALCKARLEKESISKLYGDHIKMLCDIVIKLGKIPVMWADIALKYPDALQYLPKQVIFVDWNYGWNLDMFGDHEKLMKSGFEIWGAASLRSSPDNYNLITWAKHFDNIRDFVPQSRKLGYKGMIMTSWSTSGVYSPVLESADDLLDLVAVRRVYPITAFNLYIDAFADALKTTAPFDRETYVAKYCKTNYGFSKQQSRVFLKALITTPYEVGNNKVKGSISLKQLVDSVRLSAQTLAALKPTKNKEEYAQYVLSQDIRLQYLKFQLIEAEANAADFTAVQVRHLAQQLSAVMKEMISLNSRFTELNRSVFYASELAQENQLHLAKIQMLYDRLNKSH